MRAIGALVLVACGGVEREASVEQTTMVCGGSATVQGMDVSSYESSIDWPTAKASGIDYAIIRATDGLTFHDPKFAEYWAGAKAAGVVRGAYQFFRPAEDPVAQADLLLSLAPHEAGDLPPVIDVETTAGLPQADVEAAVRKWTDHVAAAIGRQPIIYAGYYSWQDYTGNANLTRSPLWHAQYTTAPCPNIPTPWTSWAFWQYSSTGTVPGVLGEPTDLDVFDGSLDDLHAFADRAPPPCGTIAAAGGEIDDQDPCFAGGGPAATLRHVTDAGDRDGLVWTYSTASTLPGNFGQWSLVLDEGGLYRVEVYTAAAYAQAHQAAYQVRAGGVTADVVLDQTAADGWQSLGDFTFAAGDDQFVYLADNTGEAKLQLVFDAVRLTRIDQPDPPPPPPEGDGGCNTGGGAGIGVGLLVLVRKKRRARSCV